MRTRESVIEVRGLRKSFGQVRALDGLEFSVEAGEIFGILGPNGAGKTTAVECVMGAIKPDSGTLTVLGFNPSTQREPIRRHVGYQLQSTTLPPALKVAEVLRLFAALYADPADPAELLRLVGMEARSRRRIGALSGGERQRLSIATALVGRPRLAVLDELTTGLDPQARRDIWRLIQQVCASGVTIVLVSHALDEVERLCDRMAVIDAGRLKFLGTAAQLRERSQTPGESHLNLEEAYIRLLAHGQPVGLEDS